MTNFPVTLDLRIDWSELDMYGHVNNVAYHKYIQASRINYWENVGISNLYSEDRTGPMLASFTIQYKKPLHYPGNIKIRAGMEFIKNSSFGIHHQIINHKNEVAAEAHDIIVMYDFAQESKVVFSDKLRAVVEKLEGRTFPLIA